MIELAHANRDVPPAFRFDQWDRAPYNRWSFQNISAILKTEPIAPAAQPTLLPPAPFSLAGMVVDMGVGPVLLADYLAHSFVDGFLVLVDGAVAFEGYWNGMGPGTPHLLQSVSKSVVAMALGRLIENGVVDPAAPIVQYLPELASTGWAFVTLRQVMDMSSGVAYSEDYDAPDSDMAITDCAAGWKPLPEFVAPGQWPATIWTQILTLVARDEPAAFHYSSIETEVLGILIERMTGLTLAQAISRYVWQPMGAEHPASVTVGPAGGACASGGVSCSLRDLGRFGLAVARDGMVAGRQALPAGFIRDLKFGGRAELSPDYRALFPQGGYRSQFWVQDAARDVLMGLGIFGQMLYIDASAKLVIAQLASKPSPLDPHRAVALPALIRQIAVAAGVGAL